MNPYRGTQFLVVGAGFAGSLLAAKFAEHGRTVLVGKSEPGAYGNCAGGMPLSTFKKLAIDIPFAEVNSFKISVCGRIFTFPRHYICADRKQIDRALFLKALNAGAEFLRGTATSVDVSRSEITLRTGDCLSSISCAKTVLCCGARIPGGKTEIDKKKGIAAYRILESETPFPDSFYVEIDRGTSPGYCWIFPMPGGKINIGFGSFLPNRFRQRVIEDFIGKHGIRGTELCRGGGPVPLRPEASLLCGNTYIFGDTAGMVNPLNGEGLQYIAGMAASFAEDLINGRNPDVSWKRSLVLKKLRRSATAMRLITSMEKFAIPAYPAATALSAYIRSHRKHVKTDFPSR